MVKLSFLELNKYHVNMEDGEHNDCKKNKENYEIYSIDIYSFRWIYDCQQILFRGRPSKTYSQDFIKLNT